jgi:hypothetical protein
MLVPKKIMDIFQFFTIFATDKKYRKYKIICRYQQYEGANLIVNRVVAGYPKKGLLWHFQGSGKSLLMIFAAQKLRMLPELKNPTVVIVDDRIDLETQITANFNASDIPNLESAATKEGLMDFFRGDMRKILITTIFKFGEVDRELNPRTNIIQMAVMTTAKGNYRFAYLYQNQKMENFLDSHVRFFNHIGGVHKEIVYDNMKVAVARFVSKSEKVPTEDLLKISMYYGFNYRFCNTRRGNEKGHVEKSVEYIRRKVFSKKDDFKTLEEANKYLEEQLGKLNSKKQKYNEDKTAKDMIKEELPYLIKLMPTYDISRVVDLRVNKYSVVTIDENKYSVPDSLVGKFVTAKIYPQNILIYHDNKKQAQHIRSFGSHTWSIEIKHYLNTLKKKPGAIHKSTAMHQMNPKLQNIYTKLYISF